MPALRRTIVAAALCLTGLMAAPDQAEAAFVCPTGSEVWSRSELYFGLPAGATGEADFGSFVDRVVTPRFPDGLSLLQAAGQWRDKQGRVGKEASRVLVLLNPGDSASSRKLDEIRDAYKGEFQQESVLRVDSPACVAF